MTLKNILQWENSEATEGPCCLINRDFKRQCRISMVLQGSAKGQAGGGGGGRKGRGVRTGYYGLSKYTVLTLQPFRLKLESERCCCLSTTPRKKKSTPISTKGLDNNPRVTMATTIIKPRLLRSINRHKEKKKKIRGRKFNYAKVKPTV